MKLLLTRLIAHTSLACICASTYAAQSDDVMMPWEPIGVSGYVRNNITGEVKVASPELARLNNELRRSWARLGYTCRIDCSGHEAGRAWAEDNKIEDESDCHGKSRSFVEGCQAYVRYWR